MSGLEQYDRKDDRLEKARFDKCLLEYLETELIGARFGAPLGHGETWSVGGNEEAAGGPLRPGEPRIAVHEKTRLGIGPSKRQPLFALDLLPTENHPRTGTVPLDGGDLGVVPVRDKLRALRVAQSRVEGPASRVDYDGIDDVRAAARDFELDGGSLDVARCVDQCCAHGGERGQRAVMAVSV